MSNGRSIATTYDAGLRTPHYVNGRLLTAEDLRADQEAVLARLAALGQGAGRGVVDGLRVEKVDSHRICVQPGLGVNARGDVVRLRGDGLTVPVDVTPSAEAAPREEGGRFHECVEAPSEEPTVRERGAYLVALRPVSRLEGQVPVQSPGRTSECANKWAVEGVELHLIRLARFPSKDESLSKTRNRLAHWCYGSGNLRTLIQYPFTFKAAYGGLDRLEPDVLTPCDLPLAVFHWGANGIEFVDNWSARRRMVRPYAGQQWEALVSDKRQAEGEARFLQFQTQLGRVTGRGNAKADDLFAFLPPVGFLPIRPSQQLRRAIVSKLQAELEKRGVDVGTEAIQARVERVLTDDLWPDSFDLETFFDGVTLKSISLADRYPIEKRLSQSWFEQPIALDHEPTVSIYILYEDLTLFITAAFLEGLDQDLASAIIETASVTGEGISVGSQPSGLLETPGTTDHGHLVATDLTGTMSISGTSLVDYSVGWGWTEGFKPIKERATVITRTPGEEERPAWNVMLNTVAAMLHRDPALVRRGILDYNRVRTYAMFVQAELDLTPIELNGGE